MSTDEPYLPPPEPADNPAEAQQKKKSARRTLILWAVLILMVMAIYQLFTPPPSHRHAPEPPPCTSELTWWSVVGWLLPLGLVIAFLGYFRWVSRAGTRFNLAQEPGLLALAEGQLERAATVFREVAAKYSSSVHRSLARYNLGCVLLRQGNLRGAVDEAIAVEKGAGLLWSSELRLWAAILLAELYALIGQSDAAARWLADARRRLKRANNRTYAAALLRSAEAVLECRRGQFAEALRGFERDWRQLEGSLSVKWMSTAWLMRAFAAAQLDGPREAGAAPFLALLRSQPAGAWDHLAVEWPELRTFLIAHSLSTSA
jgi:tetratricopeptide (TPR) repeat protein